MTKREGTAARTAPVHENLEYTGGVGMQALGGTGFDVNGLVARQTGSKGNQIFETNPAPSQLAEKVLFVFRGYTEHPPGATVVTPTGPTVQDGSA